MFVPLNSHKLWRDVTLVKGKNPLASGDDWSGLDETRSGKSAHGVTVASKRHNRPFFMRRRRLAKN